jgi:hypothetical protein
MNTRAVVKLVAAIGGVAWGLAGLDVGMLRPPHVARWQDWRPRVPWIPRGKASDVRAAYRAEEWKGAFTADIEVRADWKVRVQVKHDDSNLYFAFEGVEHDGERLFPEMFLSTQRGKERAWWFHVSNNLCESQGEPDVYTKDGVFQCAHEKEGWDANNPPDGAKVILVRISLQKLCIEARGGAEAPVGMAFDVTDATGDAKQHRYFWPKGASWKGGWGGAELD